MSTIEKVTTVLETRRLTDERFQTLAKIPPEVEWFANIRNKNTRKAYQRDVKDFSEFIGVQRPEDFRVVTRSHLIAWRDSLEAKGLSPATVRRKLSALSSLFDYLCNENAVTHNPVTGIERPNEGSNEGKTPAISDAQARALISKPDGSSLKGKRDKAILATFLFHAIRAEELAKLKVKDVSERQGVKHLRVHGKRGKLRYIPASSEALRLIDEYLEANGHKEDKDGALFRPVKNNTTKTLEKPLHYSSVYDVVALYGRELGLHAVVDGFCVHALRTTAITNALEHQADIAKVQEWAGHASIATTRLYDRRHTRPEESPTFRVRY